MWPSLAAPRAGLARFEGFEGFEAFGGSIRQFRASRKRTTWLATAASLAAEVRHRKGTTWLATASSLAAPRARLAGFERLDTFEALGLARKRKTWLATALSLAADEVHTKGGHRRRPGRGSGRGRRILGSCVFPEPCIPGMSKSSSGGGP